MSAQVTIMGLGYIGLPTAALIAKAREFVQRWMSTKGRRYDQQRKDPHRGTRPRRPCALCRTKGFAGCQYQCEELRCVSRRSTHTPFKGDHEPDLAYVEKATRMILPQLRAGNLFIIESTSPVGTTEKMAKLIFKDRPELKGKSTSPIARNVFCRVVSFMNCSRTTG